MKYIRISLLIVFILLGVSGCQSSKANALNKEAYSLYVVQDYRGAIQKYTEAIEKYPDYADFYTNRGMSYYEVSEFELALADLDQAIKLDSKSPEAYANRGYVNLEFGNNNSALVDLNKALKLKKKFDSENGLYMTYLNMGTLQSINGNEEEAIAWYDKAIAIGTQDPGVYNAKGMVLRDLDRMDEALENYNLALDLDQEFAYAYGNRAYIYYKRGEYQIALADAITALNLEKNMPQLYMIQGIILSATGDLEGSIETFTQAIEKWTGYDEAYIQRANSYALMENYTDALIDFSLATDYGQVEGHKGKGHMYRLIGQYQDAIESYQAYLSVAGEDVDVYVELGIIYQQLKDFEKALEMFDKAISLSEDFVDPYLLKGITYEYLGDYEAAIAILEKVLEIEPDNQEALDEIKYINENFK